MFSGMADDVDPGGRYAAAPVNGSAWTVAARRDSPLAT